MKKERFREIVSSYSSTPEEVKSLQKLATDYPFSQIVHLLLANAVKKEDATEFKKSLINAALHSTDRSIVKSLIENNLVPSEIVLRKPSAVQKKQPVPKGTVSKPPLTKPAKYNAEALRKEVLKNLELLIQTKKDVAVLFEDEESAAGQKEKKKVIKPSIKKKATTGKTSKEKPVATKKSVTKRGTTNKQSKIIDEFIEKEPTITKNSKTVHDKEDLAKESAQMRDDVVSERLAKIFASQGKTEKAIEIYKKLIWKLPQKKALFAAQIEKLKKN